MTELPKGWDHPAIEDILTPMADGRLIHQGWSPQCERFPAQTADDWGVLKTTAVQPGAFVAEENKQLPAGMEPRSGIEVRPGDLLLTCAGPRARCGIACLIRDTRPRLMLSGKMYRFRVNEREVDPRFVEHALLSPALVQALDEIKTGISDSGLNLTHSRFRSLRIPLAPRAEQERIAMAVEEAFSKLDAGEAGLRTVRRLLKRMRDAVLGTAVTGRLVPQDPTDTPASKVLSDLGVDGSNEGMFDVPAGWLWVPLNGILREPLRNGMSAPAADPAVGLPTFSISAVTTGDFSETNIKYTSGAWSRADDLWAEPGDLFVQRSNTPELVGTARLYSGNPRAAIFPDLLIRVRSIPAVRPRWLEIFMTSRHCRDHVRGQARGLSGSMPKISQPVLERLPTAIPPEEEQDRIIAEVDRQFSFLDACIQAVDAGLVRSAALRRSVLKAAFEGKLVPQDPCDEPASVLLERIRRERGVAPKAARRSRRQA